jgi:hypothetical protein
LGSQPLHVVDCLWNLLALQRIELPAVGLELRIVLQRLCLFGCGLLSLKNNDSACMVA